MKSLVTVTECISDHNDTNKSSNCLFTCLQPHLYIKIHAPRTHINTRK